VEEEAGNSPFFKQRLKLLSSDKLPRSIAANFLVV